MLSVLSVKYRDILYYCMFVWRRYHIIAVVWRRYHFFWPWYHGEIAQTHVFFVHVKYVKLAYYIILLYYCTFVWRWYHFSMVRSPKHVFSKLSTAAAALSTTAAALSTLLVLGGHTLAKS